MQAATLRQRSEKLEKSKTKLTRSTDASFPPPPRSSSTHLMSARLRLISTAAVILIVFVALKAQTSSSRIQKFSDSDGGWVVGTLEKSYAICSPRGAGHAIWTAEKNGDEMVDCIVVKEKVILDTGSLGESPKGA